MAAIPVAAAATSIAGVVNPASGKNANSLVQENGGAVLSVTLSGPSVSIVEGDDVIVFFPKLEKLLELFPAAGNVRTIKFAHDDPSCAQPSPAATFTHAAFSSQDGLREDSSSPQLLRVSMGGADCKSPVMGHW